MTDASWEGLDALETSVEALLEKARRLRMPSPAKGREFASVLVQEMKPVDRFDYTPREITYYNGDDRDLVISRLTAMVYKFTTETNQYTPLFRTGGSWLSSTFTHGAGGGWSDASSTFLFDFTWNYRRDVTQARYSRQPVSSFALGDIRQKRFLEFHRPLILKKGEGLVFEMNPSLFRNVTVAGTQFIVSFMGLGYRRQPTRGGA